MIVFENEDWVPEEELMFMKMGLELRYGVLEGEWKSKRGDLIGFESKKGKM